MFPHQRLIVFQKALATSAEVIATAIPNHGRFQVVTEQLQRAATFVLLNIAEGGEEFSPAEKARLYRMARRSAAEAAAALDLLARPDALAQTRNRHLKAELGEIAVVLTVLMKRADRQHPASGPRTPLAPALALPTPRPGPTDPGPGPRPGPTHPSPVPGPN